jgi:hypothetical protein
MLLALHLINRAEGVYTRPKPTTKAKKDDIMDPKEEIPQVVESNVIETAPEVANDDLGKPWHNSLQTCYQRQVAQRKGPPWLLESMSKMVAWTWLPGKHRTECPDIVELKDARLLTMDRFAASPNTVGDRCALTLFHLSIDTSALVYFANPDAVDLFKDFSINPYNKASGLILDSKNEEIFRQALDLDAAMEMTAREKTPPTATFTPPKILLGFSHDFEPTPSWVPAMVEAARKQFHPEATRLKCLLSPGGRISAITRGDCFQTIHFERNGYAIQVQVPVWIRLDPAVQLGNTMEEKQPLGDLPRAIYFSDAELMERYNWPIFDNWLVHRIFEEATTMVPIEEIIFENGASHTVKNVWRCLPIGFVTKQLHQSSKAFVDFRQHLGRKVCFTDDVGTEIMDIDPTQVRCDVRVLPHVPSPAQLQFGDGVTWVADLMCQRVRDHFFRRERQWQ